MLPQSALEEGAKPVGAEEEEEEEEGEEERKVTEGFLAVDAGESFGSSREEVGAVEAWKVSSCTTGKCCGSVCFCSSPLVEEYTEAR